MSVKYHSRILPVLLIFLIIIICTGCGGGSGGGNTDPSVFSANLAVGKISFEGSTTQDTLYASVTGSGIGGGWIEDQVGNKLAGSDLSLESSTGKYEVLLRRSVGGFAAGTYVLKYFLDGQTYELKKENLQWITAPDFYPAPNPPEWNSSSRLLTVRYQPVSGSSVRYFLSIYSDITGTLYRETPYTYGPEISEYISAPGDYRIVLNAEILENGVLVNTARYSFSSVIRAAKTAP
jgi:hypothetical protein